MLQTLMVGFLPIVKIVTLGKTGTVPFVKEAMFQVNTLYLENSSNR